MEEQRQADGQRQQEQQRGAGKAQRHLHPAAQQVAQHATGGARQRGAQRIHADGFQPHAGGQRQAKADPAHHQALTGLAGALGQLGGQRAPAAPAAAHQQHGPPVGGEAEDEEQHVGHPGAHAAAEVVDVGHLVGVRPAGVRLAVAGQDADEGQCDRQQQEPAHFAQQLADARGQRGRIGTCCGSSSGHALGLGCHLKRVVAAILTLAGAIAPIGICNSEQTPVHL